MRILLSLFFIFLSSLGYSNIGLDVSLISKERGNNRIYINNLSRSFCNFLCGPDAYINSEYQQIQQLIELDLSLFRTSPENLEPDLRELEYQLILARDNNNHEEIQRIQLKIEQTKKEWEENYNSINKGWIKVEELRTLTKVFLSKLETKKDLHQSLKYNFNWSYYFEYRIRNSTNPNKSSYIDNTLAEDLHVLLKGLEIMSSKGVKYVAFSYG